MNLHGKILKKNLRLQNKFKGDLKSYTFVVRHSLLGPYVLCIEKLLLYKKSIDQNCFGFSNSSQYAHADINLILTIYGNKRISYLYT